MYNLDRSFNSAIAPALKGVAVVLFFGFATQDATAKDLAAELPAPTPAEAPEDEPAKPFDNIFFGATFTSDYVSRGVTNSNSKPAFQGYVEADFFENAYLNVWTSNVDFGEGFTGAEIDVATGIRPEIEYRNKDKLAINLGYVHYIYAPEHISPDYGELFAEARYTFKKSGLILGGDLYFAPDYLQSGSTATWVAGIAKVPLWNIFSAVGGFGYQFYEDSNAFQQLAWNAGMSVKLNDSWTFDIRYWDSNIGGDECVFLSGFANGCDSRVVATLTLETGVKAVRDWASGK